MTVETEWNLLGAMMLDNSIVGQYPFDLDDFSDVTNRHIYETMRSLVESGEPADAVTISETMSTEVSLLGRLAQMANETTATPNLAAYHKMLRKHGIIRRARTIAEQLGACGTLDDIESCVSQLVALSREGQSHEADQSACLSGTMDYLEQIQNGLKPGLPTGISVLDEKLGGFYPGDLIIIASRSQHGKTALMMRIANNQTEPVGVISGEQPTQQLVMRSIAMVGNVSLQRMRTGNLDSADWQGVGDAIQALHDKHILIFDKGGPSISEITAIARQWRHNKGITSLFVDFLQLVTGGDGDQHRLQIGDVARRLKTLAKQLHIPIVALAQIKRAVDDRPGGVSCMGRMPFTSDLADSAMIEDAADQIITLYRPSVYWPNRREFDGRAFLNICKNRHGQTGTVEIGWIGEYVQFRNEICNAV